MIHPILRIQIRLLVILANDDLVALSAVTLRILPAQEEEHYVRRDEAAADIEDDDAMSEDEAWCVSGSVLGEIYQR